MKFSRISVFLTVSAMVISLMVPQISYTQGQSLQHRPPFPKVNLPEQARGAKAIQVLGEKLPEVAAWYHIKSEKLKQMLLEDSTLWVDKQGRLLFIEDIQELEDPDNLPAAASINQDIPLEQTFLLHSNPQTKKIIYLDFNGHVIPANSVWANNYNGGQAITCPAWNIDGDPNSFGDTELTRIQNIWRRVAEDYAPFDVDVTTEEPPEDRITRNSSGDEYFGMRVLISPISSYYGNAGGVAYIGAFNDTTDYYKPALVFPEKLANGEKYIAEASSHETGHTLGLYHDGATNGTTYYQGHGSGEIGWAPIMGNSYYKNLSQWSKGEYALANNQEDDLQRIMLFGQFGCREDDYGNDLSTAAQIIPQGDTFSVFGTIEQNTDVDTFIFSTGQGQITINASVASPGPNLDIELKLYNDNGTLISSSNPVSNLAASISTTVSQGAYYLSIDGAANTNASDYASLGQYEISGTIISSNDPIAPVAQISASPTSGKVPLSVQFSAEGSYDLDGAITSYLWNFGDQSFSNDIRPLHAYTQPGTYSVELLVTDNSGLTDTANINITVLPENVAPAAVIETSETEGYAPLTVDLNGSLSSDSDGTIVGYSWDLGDGTQKLGQAVSHTYNNPGSYTATLTVTDNDGAKAQDNVSITASENPNFIAAPSNLSGSLNGSDIILSWQDNSNNEEGFYIERAKKVKSSFIYSVIATANADAQTYTDSNLSASTYKYRIRAFNQTTSITSEYSNETQVSFPKGGGGSNKGKR
ncbi:MAG: PKD domain-containing protein [Candidatus Omnitrophota bacterium]